MRPWRHVPPAPNFWAKPPKYRPRIPTRFKYLRSLIFIINRLAIDKGGVTRIGVRLRLIQTYAVVCQLKWPNMTGCVKLHVHLLLRFVIRIMSFVFCSHNETQCPMINHIYASAPLKYISSKSWCMASSFSSFSYRRQLTHTTQQSSNSVLGGFPVRAGFVRGVGGFDPSRTDGRPLHRKLQK